MKTIVNILALAAALTSQSADAADYTFQLLQIPGYSDTEAVGINNAGTVVLSGLPSQDSFLRDSSGAYTQIQYPGRSATVALGINNFGTVVGDTWNPATSSYIGFIRTSDGQFSNFIYPGAVGPTGGMQVNGINDSGVILGLYEVTATDAGSFIRSPTGEFPPFRYINDPRTYAYGINNLGQISGQSSFGSFLRNADGSYVSIGVPGATETQAFGLNDVGQITGLYAAGGVHGFVRGADGVFRTVDVPGAQTTQPWDINDLGQVVGIATFNGTQFGFIATPVPEPSTLALLAVGGVSICLIVRRRQAK